MADQIAMHVITRAELAANDYLCRWQDQEEVAFDGTTVAMVRMSPEKRKTILESPLAGEDDEPVRIVATAGDKAIGRCDVLPGLVEVKGERVPCLIGSSLYVVKPFRASLAGPRIVMKLNSLHHTLIGCGVSKAALPVFTGLKWRPVAMPRYVLVRRSRAVVERHLGTGGLGRLATVGADGVLLLHRGALAAVRAASCKGLTVEQVDSMPAELDDLAEPAASDVAVWHDSSFVNWLLHHSFRADPSFRKGLFLVRDQRGRVAGYFLVKARLWEQASRRGFRNLLLGSLADWAIYDPSALRLDQLALLAAAEVGRFDVDAVEFCLPPEYLDARLARLGCRHVDAMYFIARMSKDSPLTKQGLDDPATWRFRPGSADHFFT
jgi:hypothetical protein